MAMMLQQLLLQKYGIRSFEAPVPVSGGFSGAGVWRVQAESRTFALRRWPNEGLPDRRILGLHQLLAHIESRGVTQVAVPLRSTVGTSLVITDGHRWQLEPWLPGVADFGDNPSDLRLTETMRSLAHWHTTARSFESSRDARLWFRTEVGPSTSVCRRLELCEEWAFGVKSLQPAIARDDTAFGAVSAQVARLATHQLPRIRTDLTRFAGVAVPLQPCLRDIWHDHVLFQKDEVSGLIDPAATAVASVATDLARLLGSLLDDDLPRWHAAVEHYCTRRPMTSVEQQLIFALDRAAVVLSPLTWLRRRYVEHAAFDESAVLVRLRRQLARLENLAGRQL